LSNLYISIYPQQKGAKHLLSSSALYGCLSWTKSEPFLRKIPTQSFNIFCLASQGSQAGKIPFPQTPFLLPARKNPSRGKFPREARKKFKKVCLSHQHLHHFHRHLPSSLRQSLLPLQTPRQE